MASDCEDCGTPASVTEEGYRCPDCRRARRESREAAEADRRVVGRS